MSPRQGNPLDKAFRRYFQDLWQTRMGPIEAAAGPSFMQGAGPAGELDVVVLPDRYEISLSAEIAAGIVDERQLLVRLADALHSPAAVDLSRARIVRARGQVKVVLPKAQRGMPGPHGGIDGIAAAQDGEQAP